MHLNFELLFQRLWIECQGVYPHDQEHVGNISYYPDQSFLGRYFPFGEEIDYPSPLVAVKLNNIKRKCLMNQQTIVLLLTPGVVVFRWIHYKCSLHSVGQKYAAFGHQISLYGLATVSGLNLKSSQKRYFYRF